MHKENDLFITIEGGHGCGKSSICTLLVRNLRDLNFTVIETNDQTGTAIGRELRKINVEQIQWPIGHLTEALLIAAARHQNVLEIIKPNLSQEQVVICERFTDAFIAFQGYARGLPINLLENINKLVAEDIIPDITILLDIHPSIALNRISNQSKHRIEKESINFHMKVREGYLLLAAKYPNRIKVFDAERPIGEVFENVWKEVSTFINIL